MSIIDLCLICETPGECEDCRFKNEENATEKESEEQQ